MRISDRQRWQNASQIVKQNRSAQHDASEALASQKKLRRIDQNPSGYAKVTQINSDLFQNEQFEKNISHAKGILSSTEVALGSIQDYLVRLKELSVAMSNDTNNAETRKIVASEVKEIINGIVSIGNTSHQGRYVFSGFRNKSPALSSKGEYLGDDGAVYLEVSKGNYKKINIPGNEIFGKSLRGKEEHGFISDLKGLADSLLSNDKKGIGQALGNVNLYINKVSILQGEVGSIFKNLELVQTNLSEEDLRSHEMKSDLEDVDLVEASIQMQQVESVLQSSLLATKKVLGATLFDLLD